MKQVKWFCDRCGNEIEDTETSKLLYVSDHDSNDVLDSHMCGACYHGLRRWYRRVRRKK